MAAEKSADIHVIVKIESADSIPNLQSILDAADGVSLYSYVVMYWAAVVFYILIFELCPCRLWLLEVILELSCQLRKCLFCRYDNHSA